jgi:hypothetical protein
MQPSTRVPLRPPLETPAARDLLSQLDRDCVRAADYILATADYARTDRLWPADYFVFLTNPLSLAYGACGTALFLQQTLGNVPPQVRDWLLSRLLSVDAYPPGLFHGLAGIAYSFLELGLQEEAEAVWALQQQSPLLFAEPSVAMGAAGWGLVALHLFKRTGRSTYLEDAVSAGEFVLKTAQLEDRGISWRCNEDHRVHYGFGYGASGIALFLTYLHASTNRPAFRDTAIKALDSDNANRSESAVGLQWKRFEGDSLLFPYFVHGSAGVGAVALRVSALLGIERYAELAVRLGKDAYIKWSYIPSLFEGLTGIGEFLLDLYLASGDADYYAKALDLAETILWFEIEKPEGIAFPGRWLTRISNDYATGSAGIGLFFQRLLQPLPRLYMDLDVPRAPLYTSTRDATP